MLPWQPKLEISDTFEILKFALFNKNINNNIKYDQLMNLV